MITPTRNYAFLGFFILVILAIGGMLWINYRFSSLEFFGDDFYVYWIGTRVLLVDGTSPFEVMTPEFFDTTSEFTSTINANSGVSSIPLYAYLFTLPFSLIEDYVLARATWLTAQEIALILLIFVMIQLTNWRPKLHVFTFLVICLYFSVLSITNLLAGNLVIWTALFFTLALGAVKARRDELAGALFALTTFQPQLFILVYIFIILWSIFQKRRLIIIWFFGVLLVLTIICIFIIPDWPIQYFRGLLDLPEQPTYTSISNILTERWPGLGLQLSWIVTLGFSALLLIEWWLARLKSFRWFVWTMCLTIVISRLIGFPVNFIHNIILFIPFILVFAVLQERWKIAGGWINISILLIFFIGGWLLVFEWEDKLPTLSSAAPLFVLPGLLLIILYWVRWWANREHRLYVQEMLSGD